MDVNETELQELPWDVSYEEGDDVIMVDTSIPVYLTKSDLQTMLEALE